MTDTNERPDQTGAGAPAPAADDWADALAEQSRDHQRQADDNAQDGGFGHKAAFSGGCSSG